MVRGLFTAYTGMANEQKRLDIVTNNLANAATVGYKEESVTNQAFDQLLTIKIKDSSDGYVNRPIGRMSLGVKLGEAYTSFTQGSLRETGNTYDLAIEGKGFFKVSVTDKNGNQDIKYTRDGSFKYTQDGYIVDADGNHLQGESGDVQVPTDAVEVAIDTQGNIFADGQFVDKIKAVDIADYNYLERYADNMYALVDGGAEIESDCLIRQGYTEQSNVNSVTEMVEMISITRAYEANQKAIQTIDSMLDKAVNSVGRI